MEIWRLDAFDQSRKLRDGTLTPNDLLRHYQARIAHINPSLNAIVCHSDQAESDANDSTKRRADGKPLSALDGIPVLVKDNIVVAGMPATWGSRLYADRVCEADELPVEKLRQAGAIIIGKSNVPEFTIEGFTDNEIFGLTPNPWNTDLTPGGSSGGSVAAVAAGLAPLAIGTDGGGSIRRPAAYTNLVGLKPSIGRIPRSGGLPQLLLDMEVVGPITRTVRDQAMLFDVMAQPDSRDHRSLQFDPADSLSQLDHAVGSLKILAVERFGDAPLDPTIRAAFQQTLEHLKMLGHTVEIGALPLDIKPINERWASIGTIGLALLLEKEPSMATLASAKYVEWAKTAYSATHLLETSEIIHGLRSDASRVFESVDIIVTPTCAAMPWATGIPFPSTIDGEPVGPRGSAIYTGWVNACGLPGINIPATVTDTNLPIGVQMIGAFGQDELLLRLARQIESDKNWSTHWPAMASIS